MAEENVISTSGEGGRNESRLLSLIQEGVNNEKERDANFARIMKRLAKSDDILHDEKIDLDAKTVELFFVMAEVVLDVLQKAANALSGVGEKPTATNVLIGICALAKTPLDATQGLVASVVQWNVQRNEIKEKWQKENTNYSEILKEAFAGVDKERVEAVKKFHGMVRKHNIEDIAPGTSLKPDRVRAGNDAGALMGR